MTCAGCGCVCDDGRLCPLGEAWFELGERPPLARIDGAEASFDEAVAAAAALLRGARAPLVYGLAATSIEAQRRAVGLAEALGAVIDSGGSAYQPIGSSTATLGEIRDRAELVVLWRADPATTHPRLFERLRVDPESLVVLDDDFEALWELRASKSFAGDARHVAFLHGPLDDLAALALAALVRDLNRDRHAVTLALRGGNARGAEDVLAWQTGFAGAVSFARGVPRESPGAAELLARGDVDAALLLAPLAVDVPAVAVSRHAIEARVAFGTAADGIEVAGTVHRMDGVPLPLDAQQATERPSVEAVLAAIEGHG